MKQDRNLHNTVQGMNPSQRQAQRTNPCEKHAQATRVGTHLTRPATRAGNHVSGLWNGCGTGNHIGNPCHVKKGGNPLLPLTQENRVAGTSSPRQAQEQEPTNGMSQGTRNMTHGIRTTTRTTDSHGGSQHNQSARNKSQVFKTRQIGKASPETPHVNGRRRKS